MITLEDLSESPPDELLPPLDRAGAVPSTPLQAQWTEKGFAVLPGFLPDELIDAYCAVWQPDFSARDTLYLQCPEARALCCFGPLAEAMAELGLGTVAVHLNLAGWISTERDWHQDDYLNPPFINSWYCAAWMALGDIDPRSGPFECIPGSHRWPLVRREKMLAALGQNAADPAWPKHSERILTPLYEEKIANEKLETFKFVAKRGDVLLWHGRLVHRGSPPEVTGLERRGLIAHYSTIERRHDMPQVARHREGGQYFVLGRVH